MPSTHEHKKEGPDLPVLTPKEDLVGRTVRLPQSLWDQLDRIADEANYSRNEVHVKFIEWAVKQYEEEKAAEKKKR